MNGRAKKLIKIFLYMNFLIFLIRHSSNPLNFIQKSARPFCSHSKFSLQYGSTQKGRVLGAVRSFESNAPSLTPNPHQTATTFPAVQFKWPMLRLGGYLSLYSFNRKVCQSVQKSEYCLFGELFYKEDISFNFQP